VTDLEVLDGTVGELPKERIDITSDFQYQCAGCMTDDFGGWRMKQTYFEGAGKFDPYLMNG
jgi:hypothetical protein